MNYMPTEKRDPLEELYTSSGLIDDKKIVDTIKSYVVIQRDTNTIYLTSGAKILPVDKKILIYGLAKKLLGLKKKITDDSFSAAELDKATDLKKGSIDSTFKRLRNEGSLVGKGKSYEIPDYKIDEIINLLTRKKYGHK